VATRATGVGFQGDGGGLTRESLVDHALRDGLSELDGQFLQFGELGPPGHARGAIDPMDQLFGDTLEEVFQFRLRKLRIDVACHPLLLKDVVSRRGE
jgi:hypothetical protein